jgi:FixJ family two-component response regulator
MDLVVAGKANKHIGEALCVSAKTVEVHRKHVMKKMRASSVVELVRMVLSLRGAERSA